MLGRIFVAIESFACYWNGYVLSVHKGDTVREGHPLLEGREKMFAPLKVKYEHKAPSPAPAKKPAPRRKP